MLKKNLQNVLLRGLSDTAVELKGLSVFLKVKEREIERKITIEGIIFVFSKLRFSKGSIVCLFLQKLTCQWEDN